MTKVKNVSLFLIRQNAIWLLNITIQHLSRKLNKALLMVHSKVKQGIILIDVLLNIWFYVITEVTEIKCYFLSKYKYGQRNVAYIHLLFISRRKKVNEYSRSTSQDIIVTRCQTRMKNIYSSIKQQHRKMKTVYFNHIFHSKGRELNNHDNLCLSYKKKRKQENQHKEFFMEK